MIPKSRTLIVDAQLFQSYTFHRGMGKYSLSLIEHLAERLPEYIHKVLVFNNISGYLSEEEMSRIKDAAKGFSFEFLGFKHLGDYKDYKSVKQYNQGVIDDYISKRLPDQEVDFLILSLFQETEVSVFPTYCTRKGLVVYDLIPLQFFDPYLKADNLATNYLSRFDTLLDADHFFPISQSVATDLTLHLGIPPSRITPIYGAPTKRRHLTPEPLSLLESAKIILFPTGEDFRKNNARTIKAFERFNKAHDDIYTLVITSSFSQHTVNELKRLSKKVVFTGNVNEAQIAWLYDRSELVLFLSYTEGLGLPILEAVEFGKRILCSDIAVFKEINNKDLFFCDPYQQSAITDGIERAINSAVPKKASYDKVLKKYNWENTADEMARILKKPSGDILVPKKKIAIFSPKPDGFSGIGKVVQEQHYVISRLANVTYFFEEGISERAQNTEIRKNYLAFAADVRDPWSFDSVSKNEFDRVIYHIGNGEYHAATLIKALSYPDTVVLHDTRIRGLYNVVRSQGLISEARYIAEDTVDQMTKSENGEFLVSLVNKQRKVVVHSDYAARAVETVILDSTSGLTVSKLNLAIPTAFHVDPVIPGDTIYVAMAGLMTGSKGIDLANKITKIKMTNLTFKVKIFGFSMLDQDEIKDLTKNKSIEFIESPTDTRYLHELSQSHIMLNFRKPYHGETSYSTLEGLRFGKNVILNDIGWFAELPEKLVYKISSSKQILDKIKDITSKNYSHVSSNQRLDFIARDHTVESYVIHLLSKEGRK